MYSTVQSIYKVIKLGSFSYLNDDERNVPWGGGERVFEHSKKKKKKPSIRDCG